MPMPMWSVPACRKPTSVARQYRSVDVPASGQRSWRGVQGRRLCGNEEGAHRQRHQGAASELCRRRDWVSTPISAAVPSPPTMMACTSTTPPSDRTCTSVPATCSWPLSKSAAASLPEPGSWYATTFRTIHGLFRKHTTCSRGLEARMGALNMPAVQDPSTPSASPPPRPTV